MTDDLKSVDHGSLHDLTDDQLTGLAFDLQKIIDDKSYDLREVEKEIERRGKLNI